MIFREAHSFSDIKGRSSESPGVSRWFIIGQRTDRGWHYYLTDDERDRLEAAVLHGLYYKCFKVLDSGARVLLATKGEPDIAASMKKPLGLRTSKY